MSPGSARSRCRETCRGRCRLAVRSESSSGWNSTEICEPRFEWLGFWLSICRGIVDQSAPTSPAPQPPARPAAANQCAPSPSAHATPQARLAPAPARTEAQPALAPASPNTLLLPAPMVPSSLLTPARCRSWRCHCPAHTRSCPPALVCDSTSSLLKVIVQIVPPCLSLPFLFLSFPFPLTWCSPVVAPSKAIIRRVPRLPPRTAVGALPPSLLLPSSALPSPSLVPSAVSRRSGCGLVSFSCLRAFVVDVVEAQPPGGSSTLDPDRNPPTLRIPSLSLSLSSFSLCTIRSGHEATK